MLGLAENSLEILENLWNWRRGYNFEGFEFELKGQRLNMQTEDLADLFLEGKIGIDQLKMSLDKDLETLRNSCRFRVDFAYDCLN